MNYIELDEVDSTNEYIKRNINTLQHLTIVRCNYQTKGKGRSDHTWQSNKNNDLLMSILIRDFKDPTLLHQMTGVIACSIIEALKSYEIAGLIKWPNDIYANDLKICGILIEAIYDGSLLQGVIIGIGLNINETKGIFQSMKMIKGKTYDIKEVMIRILTHFKIYYNLYQVGSYNHILQRANNLSFLKDKKINYDKYGLVRFDRLNIDGTLTIIDSKERQYNIYVNEISLSK